MRSVFDQLRNRVVPALLTAAGIALVAAGLLSYSAPADAVPPSAGDSGLPMPSATDPLGLFSMPPLSTPYPSGSGGAAPSLTPTPTPTPDPSKRVATRIVVSALGIDLPVVRTPPNNAFPYCDVAMYFDHKTTPGVPFVQPGQTGTVFIFAHARTGMFLPLLTRSWTDNGSSMLGLLVRVYSSDDQAFIYKINQIIRHVPGGADLNSLPMKDGELILQTSEGDAKTTATNTKLYVIAQSVSSLPVDDADANPVPHRRICS